jgi:hypothetical protein
MSPDSQRAGSSVVPKQPPVAGQKRKKPGETRTHKGNLSSLLASFLREGNREATSGEVEEGKSEQAS